MKLAFITDPKGFFLLKEFGLSYHLTLAQYVLEGFHYRDFYKDAHNKGDFIMIDNGAAEDGTLSLANLLSAADSIQADEIILPDVMGDMEATINKSFDIEVMRSIPQIKRAVVPQGNSADEWMNCANYFAENMEFATMCVPKHAERFSGGRLRLLETIRRLGWHLKYNIHLLGVWSNPVGEIAAVNIEFPWVRGLDTAAPFAYAQESLNLRHDDLQGHVSHVWGKTFNRTIARSNIEHLIYLGTRS